MREVVLALVTFGIELPKCRVDELRTDNTIQSMPVNPAQNNNGIKYAHIVVNNMNSRRNAKFTRGMPLI